MILCDFEPPAVVDDRVPREVVRRGGQPRARLQLARVERDDPRVAVCDPARGVDVERGPVRGPLVRPDGRDELPASARVLGERGGVGVGQGGHAQRAALLERGLRVQAVRRVERDAVHDARCSRDGGERHLRVGSALTTMERQDRVQGTAGAGDDLDRE